eukprot:CAMPEP_0117537236 /NCGR_PEP_ID=MMETSP0784-20121206/41860_1 /TAXON_ID=39447 /ORGANISM="" /LENGTH=518 /DNA_ID=CAMNT_0005333815 /DNA_START=181 /DNA_END=1734 /DNA_ORIENTATION=+
MIVLGIYALLLCLLTPAAGSPALIALRASAKRESEGRSRDLADPPVPWAAADVPNPNTQYKECNLVGPGGLCDPDGILSPGGRVNILDALTAIRQKTNLTCPDGTLHGYQVAVLIVQKMKVQGGVEASAKAFATDVGNAWGVGDKGCDNGIVLFLSITDRYAYIKTTDVTRKALADADATQVVDNMKPLLRSQDYDGAVLQATLQTYDVLTGAGLPRSSAGAGITAGQVILFFFVVICVCPGLLVTCCGWLYVAMVAIFCFPLAFAADGCTRCCAARTAKRSGHEIEAVEADLERVQRELERGEYDQTMCPICLESLGSETTTLGCRHKYHTACIDPWVAQRGSCPLCRADVIDQPLSDEETQQPESYQRRLRFYLSRVQARNQSVFASRSTYGTVEDRPAMYRRDHRTGCWRCSDYYAYDYYPYGSFYPYYYSASAVATPTFSASLASHLAATTAGTQSWASSIQGSADFLNGGGGRSAASAAAVASVAAEAEVVAGEQRALPPETWWSLTALCHLV